MAKEQHENPTTDTESDISKAQSQQQPPQQASQDLGETGKQAGQYETDQGQADKAPDEELIGVSLTEQPTDVEGETPKASNDIEGGFVGSQANDDTSEELVEEEANFGKDGQGAPEGK